MQAEVRLFAVNMTEFVIEKERIKSKYDKCGEELTACQGMVYNHGNHMPTDVSRFLWVRGEVDSQLALIPIFLSLEGGSFQIINYRNVFFAQWESCDLTLTSRGISDIKFHKKTCGITPYTAAPARMHAPVPYHVYIT